MKQWLLLIFLTTVFSSLLAQTTSVNIVDFAFSPADITISEGTTVMWSNGSASVHTSTSGTDCSNDGIWDSGNISPSETYTMTFDSDSEGFYPYFCIPHCATGMTGSITVESSTSADVVLHANEVEVFPNPFTDRLHIQGQFDVKDELTVRMFDMEGHEVLTREHGFMTRDDDQFTIPTNRLSKGIYVLTIEQEGQRVLNKKITKFE